MNIKNYWIKSVLLIACLMSCAVHAQNVLDGGWTVTVNGQSVTVNADGTFRIPNISAPDDFGPGGPGTRPDFLSDDFVRVLGTRTHNGITEYAFSRFFRMRQGQTISINELTLASIPPPQTESILATPDNPLLTAIGATTQVRVTALVNDGSSIDVTLNSAWTSYRISNTAIATITNDGLVTAVGRGMVFVTAVNEGATSVTQLTVSPGDPTTVIDGLVMNLQEEVIANASVQLINFDAQAVTDSSGNYRIPDIAILFQNTVNLLALVRPPIGPPLYGYVIDLPLEAGGITDAGIIHVDLLDPTDSDGDGLADILETLLGLDPNDPDSDGDGILDGNEDQDSDSLSDGDEYLLGTSPIFTDTDSDGISDADEDFDEDGLTNADEFNIHGTNPLLFDTDNDSWPDEAEVSFPGDPLNPLVIPSIFQLVYPPTGVVIIEGTVIGSHPLNTVIAQPPVSVFILNDNTAEHPLNVTIAHPPVQLEFQ